MQPLIPWAKSFRSCLAQVTLLPQQCESQQHSGRTEALAPPNHSLFQVGADPKTVGFFCCPSKPSSSKKMSWDVMGTYCQEKLPTLCSLQKPTKAKSPGDFALLCLQCLCSNGSSASDTSAVLGPL